MGLFSSGKSKSTTTSYLPVQKQIMESFLPDVYGEVQGGPNVYPGQRVAGLTGTQQGLLGGLGAWSQYLTPTTGGAMYGQTGGGPVGHPRRRDGGRALHGGVRQPAL